MRLTNPTATAQSLFLRVGDTDYAAPTGAVTLLNSIAGTVVTGGAGNVFNSTACADPTNSQNLCPGADLPDRDDLRVRHHAGGGQQFQHDADRQPGGALRAVRVAADHPRSRGEHQFQCVVRRRDERHGAGRSGGAGPRAGRAGPGAGTVTR